MTAASHARRRTGRWRLAAAAGTALVLLLGVTASSFTDHAQLSLGTGTAGSGVGNPHIFDIAVFDDAGIAQDAATADAAVVLTPAGEATLSTTVPVEFTARVVNRDTSMAGSISVVAYDPDPVAEDLFAELLFTVHLDGAASPAAADVSAIELNEAAVGWTNVAPGDERTVRVSVLLARELTLEDIGRTTTIGLRMDGESS